MQPRSVVLAAIFFASAAVATLFYFMRPTGSLPAASPSPIPHFPSPAVTASERVVRPRQPVSSRHERRPPAASLPDWQGRAGLPASPAVAAVATTTETGTHELALLLAVTGATAGIAMFLRQHRR